MKKIVFSMALLCLLLKLKSYAQNLNDDIEHMFNGIDKSQITSGYLHDKATWIGNLFRYNGVFDTTCDRNNFEQLYDELYQPSRHHSREHIVQDSSLAFINLYIFFSINFNCNKSCCHIYIIQLMYHQH